MLWWDFPICLLILAIGKKTVCFGVYVSDESDGRYHPFLTSLHSEQEWLLQDELFTQNLQWSTVYHISMAEAK